MTSLDASPVLRWAAATDVGLKRETNEDSFAAQVPVFVVADGMGGHLAGEVASDMAVTTLLEHFADQPDEIHIDDVTASVKMANLAIFRASRSDAARHGMGTTLTAVVQLDGEHLGLVNVGDSRAYLLRNGKMRQVSIDHSYVQELLSRGEIRPHEARTHPNRNIVTRALGVEPMIDVDAWIFPMVRGDRFMLCSDGLCDEVVDERIEAALNLHDDPSIAAHRLVELALQAGGRDNITVVLVDVLEGADPATGVPDVTAMLPEVPPVRPDPVSGELPITRRVPSDVEDPTDTTGVIRRSPLVEFDQSNPSSADTQSPVGRALGGRRTEPAEPGAPRTRRRVSLMTVVFATLVVGVFVAAFVAAAAYARSGYFVDFNEQNKVTIYKGRPDGLLWFDPTVAQTSAVDRAALDGAQVEKVDAQLTFESIDRASRFVSDLDPALSGSGVEPANTPTPQTAPPQNTAPQNTAPPTSSSQSVSSSP